MIVLPALPDAEKNRMMHCTTRNMVKLVVQSTGQAPSTAHPIPSEPIQLQFPYVCKTQELFITAVLPTARRESFVTASMRNLQLESFISHPDLKEISGKVGSNLGRIYFRNGFFALYIQHYSVCCWYKSCKGQLTFMYCLYQMCNLTCRVLYTLS